MTLRECICSSALQSWTKYFHTVLSGISLLCFLKCYKSKCKRTNTDTDTHRHTHTRKIKATLAYLKEETIKYLNKSREYCTRFKMVAYKDKVCVRLYSIHSQSSASTPWLMEPRPLSSQFVSCLTEPCLIFAVAYNRKHMYFEEEICVSYQSSPIWHTAL